MLFYQWFVGFVNQTNIYAFEAAKAIANFSNPWLNYLLSYLAISFLIVLPAIALYMYIKKDMNVYSFVVAAILFYVASEIIKFIVKEPRPCSVASLNWINSISCENSFSFPSNHASVVVGLEFFLSSYKYLRWLYLTWVLLVLFGRVYLGVHYLSDVVAGVILSLILYWIINKYKSKINGFANTVVGKIIPKAAIK
ncbi:MAG: phosphatase PAP2 family protein [Candidatus Micrarchaeaceae archaeon]